MAKGQPNVSVGRDDLEKDRKYSEGCIVVVHDVVRFRNADAEDTEKDVPQVKAQLIAEVRKDVSLAVPLVHIWFRKIYAQRALFVRVGGSDRDRDREYCDVHHHQQGKLNCRVNISQVVD